MCRSGTSSPRGLPAVLEAIYAIYAEGWSDPAGTQARTRGLAEEGIWLGRLVASLLPEGPEALGLLALMLHAEARREARRDAAGEFVPLNAQDPARWNAALIEEAEALPIIPWSMVRIHPGPPIFQALATAARNVRCILREFCVSLREFA